MPFDAHKNLAYSLVAVAPSPAASGTSLTVTSGQGSRFPATPFNATVWAADVLPVPTNAEVIRVTGIAGDVLTIVRAQEGTSARSILVGDQIAATITNKVLTDIEDTASNAVSAAVALSLAVSALSTALSNEQSVRAAADASLANAVSVVSNALSNEISNRVSAGNALSQAISVVSNAVSNETSNRTSADNVLSQAISVISQQVSVLSNTVSVHSQRFSTLRGGTTGQVLKKVDATDFNWTWSTDLAGGGGSVDVTSQHFSVLSQQASVHSQQISVHSQQISVLSQGLSVVSNALSNEISNRTSADNAVSVQAASAISQLNSVVSQGLSLMSQRISVVSNAVSIVSTAASNALSVANAIKSVVSIVSSHVSAGGASVRGLQAAIDNLSQRISVEGPVGGGGGGSVTSTELSAASAQAASAISDAKSIMSVAIAAVSSRVDSVQSAVSNMQSAVSNVSATSQGGGSATGLQAVVDALSNRLSAIPGGGSATDRAVGIGTVFTVAATTLTNITSLALSVSAGVAYEIIANVLYSTDAAQVIGAGLRISGAGPAGGIIQCDASIRLTGSPATFFSTTLENPFHFETSGIAGGLTVVSLTTGGSVGVHHMYWHGSFFASIAATAQMRLRASASPGHAKILPGSFLRLVRI